MAFKFVVFAAILAYANAGVLGGPAAIATYSAAPAVSSAYINTAAPALAVAHAAPVLSTYAAGPVAVPSIGASQQNVYRSFGGAQSVSTYSKAVDSPFSSVRKYDTRITNDGLSVAPYAAYAPTISTYAAPAVSAYAASALSAYAAPAISSYAAPALSAYRAPLAYSSPVLAKTVAAAPVAYSPAAVVAHTSFDGLGAHYAW